MLLLKYTYIFCIILLFNSKDENKLKSQILLLWFPSDFISPSFFPSNAFPNIRILFLQFNVIFSPDNLIYLNPFITILKLKRNLDLDPLRNKLHQTKKVKLHQQNVNIKYQILHQHDGYL